MMQSLPCSKSRPGHGPKTEPGHPVSAAVPGDSRSSEAHCAAHVASLIRPRLVKVLASAAGCNGTPQIEGSGVDCHCEATGTCAPVVPPRCTIPWQSCEN